MNDFHMMNLAKDTAAQRRAEADRHRLVRAARAQAAEQGPRTRTRRETDARSALGALFGRLALR